MEPSSDQPNSTLEHCQRCHVNVVQTGFSASFGVPQLVDSARQTIFDRLPQWQFSGPAGRCKYLQRRRFPRPPAHSPRFPPRTIIDRPFTPTNRQQNLPAQTRSPTTTLDFGPWTPPPSGGRKPFGVDLTPAPGNFGKGQGQERPTPRVALCGLCLGAARSPSPRPSAVRRKNPTRQKRIAITHQKVALMRTPHGCCAILRTQPLLSTNGTHSREPIS